jgi:hypothetical protein
MKKYQKFVDDLERIKNEEDQVKKLYMKEFLSDIENELINLGAVVEEVDPKTLGVRYKDSTGIFSTFKTNIKIFWMYEKKLGLHLMPYETFNIIQVHEISFDKYGKRTFKNFITHLEPYNNLLDDKRYDASTFIRKKVKNLIKETKKKEFKRDVKKYNL